MLKRERQAFILHQVNLHNRVLSSGLSTEMKVSEDTIRRDLQELAGVGKLIKVHGGALSPSFDQLDYPSDKVYSQSQKIQIAQKAVSLIRDGMFILSGGGTTIIEMARTLPPQLKATFISGSIPAIVEYMHHPQSDVIVIGDKISKGSKISVGAEAIKQINQIKADVCFLGINAIDIQHGITDNDWDVVQIKKAMIEASRKIVCMTIAEKINSYQPLHICGLKRIDVLVTELPPDAPVLQPYVEAGIKVL
jgi:DeoR/GlpR family transcriptional regulator of sugar metabolism